MLGLRHSGLRGRGEVIEGPRVVDRHTETVMINFPQAEQRVNNAALGGLLEEGNRPRGVGRNFITLAISHPEFEAGLRVAFGGKLLELGQGGPFRGGAFRREQYRRSIAGDLFFGSWGDAEKTSRHHENDDWSEN